MLSRVLPSYFAWAQNVQLISLEFSLEVESEDDQSVAIRSVVDISVAEKFRNLQLVRPQIAINRFLRKTRKTHLATQIIIFQGSKRKEFSSCHLSIEGHLASLVPICLRNISPTVLERKKVLTE